MTGSNGICPEHDREHYVISDETVTWNFIVTEEDGAYTWTAEPVEEGNDDICKVAHDWIVTFDADNGTEPQTQNVRYEGKATKPADPTKEGNWKFVAWYLGENEFDFDTVITDDITLTAHWNKTPSVVEPKAAAYRALLRTDRRHIHSQRNRNTCRRAQIHSNRGCQGLRSLLRKHKAQRKNPVRRCRNARSKGRRSCCSYPQALLRP